MSALHPSLLKAAYSNGFFPMGDDQSGEIHWYRPDPRAILPLNAFHCSRSSYRPIRQKRFRRTFDQAFIDVMRGCADREETWITDEFINAYHKLFQQGHAHSVEIWEEKQLVGGVYGVTIGGAFFAESKFYRSTNASKVALYYLVEHLKLQGFSLLEVQFLTPHLIRQGAIEVSDDRYQTLLRKALALKVVF